MVEKLTVCDNQITSQLATAFGVDENDNRTRGYLRNTLHWRPLRENITWDIEFFQHVISVNAFLH